MFLIYLMHILSTMATMMQNILRMGALLRADLELQTIEKHGFRPNTAVTKNLVEPGSDPILPSRNSTSELALIETHATIQAGM